MKIKKQYLKKKKFYLKIEFYTTIRTFWINEYNLIILI